MLNTDDPTKRRTRRSAAIGAAATLALAASLLSASSATAGADVLAGGSVAMTLKGSGGLKFKPSKLNVAIARGELDPVTGQGTVEVNAKLTAKRGKKKTKVKLTSFSFGADGAAGKIAAKIGKTGVKSFGTVRGGTTVRDGFGAKLTGARAKLSPKAAKLLGKRLLGKVKAGKPLGSVGVTTVPKTVEVLPGGSIVLATDPGLITKLLFHCINGVPGMGGAYPVPPATQDLMGAFTFPVTGGAVAPDLTDGRVISAGGQNLTKNVGLALPNDCTGPPAVGTTVLQDLFQVQFNNNALAANTVLPSGPVGVATLGLLGAGSRSLDPNTKQLSMSGVPVLLDSLSAYILNQVFPNASGDPANDFQGGDPLGTLSVTATLR